MTAEIFFFKNRAENKAGRLVFQTSCCFLKKFYMRQKQLVCGLVSITFDSPQLGKQKQNI